MEKYEFILNKVSCTSFLNISYCSQIFSHQAGLKKLFFCHHLTLDLRVGSVGQNFFYFDESQRLSQGLTIFWYKLGRREKNLYPQLSSQSTEMKLWIINATRGYDLTSEPQKLEALQNVFILICCCEIYPYYE